MKKWILGSSFLFIVIYSYADYSYDYHTGNSYTTTQQGNSVNVQGYNMNNGTNWNTTIEQNGNQRGTDSSGNSWTYNNQSGYYQNSDGTTCMGKGPLRSCN